MGPVRTDLVLLAGRGDSSSIVYHRLARRFGAFPVIVEHGVPKWTMVKVRAKKLGVLRVLSQLAFMTMIRPFLTRNGRNTIEEHCRDNDMDRTPIPPEVTTVVESVNSHTCREALKAFAPRVVVVNGTRIIFEVTLGAVAAQFINTHAGITPKYRGSHGAYWALFHGDRENCGATVHAVDRGIDTGNILGHALIAPGDADNFATYPYLQLAAALPVLEDCVARALQSRLEGRKAEGPSDVWYHPGFMQYLSARLRGVK